MATRRLLICNAIVAKLATISGLTARWLHDGEFDENTEASATAPQAIVVPGSDTLSGPMSNGVQRELVGHVIVETNVGEGEVDDTKRAAVDEVVADVESALLDLHADSAALGVPGVTEFNVTETLTTFDGGGNGRFAARIDWLCSYRHAAADSREVP